MKDDVSPTLGGLATGIAGGRWQKESPNKPRFQLKCFPMTGFSLECDQRLQIMENPVSRRRPCQKRQLVDVIGDQGDGCPKQHTKEGI